MPESRSKTRNYIRETLRRFWISGGAFLENDLFTYAAAGAYNFFLSTLPVLLIVLAVLLRVFHASPASLLEIIDTFIPQFNIFNYADAITSVSKVKTIGLFEVILGVATFWMARRFLTSFQRGLTKIWRKRGKGKPIRENLLVIGGEVILVIIIVTLVIAVTTANAFFGTALSQQLLNPTLVEFLRRVFRYAPLGAIFLFLFLVYYFLPRVRPEPRFAAATAGISTISFWVIQAVFSGFINMTRYNLVYGILGNVIVLILEVYTFFLLFLYWAQFLYVTQFYESFLISRIYLLPAKNDTNLINRFERHIFHQPELFYRKYSMTCSAGETIYAHGDDSQDLFYIWDGHLHMDTDGQKTKLADGHIFGEIESISGGKRISTVKASTDCTLLKIPESIFLETLEIDGELSRRALLSMTDFLLNRQE